MSVFVADKRYSPIYAAKRIAAYDKSASERNKVTLMEC